MAQGMQSTLRVMRSNEGIDGEVIFVNFNRIVVRPSGR